MKRIIRGLASLSHLASTLIRQGQSKLINPVAMASTSLSHRRMVRLVRQIFLTLLAGRTVLTKPALLTDRTLLLEQKLLTRQALLSARKSLPEQSLRQQGMMKLKEMLEE